MKASTELNSKRSWTDTDPSIPNSYWLVGDDRLDHSMDRKKANVLYAHFVHSLLYNPRLMISDSYAINNPNFRYLLQKDSRLRDVINVDTLALARRTNVEGKVVPLLELRNEFVSSNRKNPNLSDVEFKEDTDLIFLQVATSMKKYSLSTVSQSYTDSTFSLLQSQTFRAGLSVDFVDRIVELANIARSEKKALLRSFFHNELASKIGEECWKQHGERLKQIGDAFYFGALPNSLGATPIFPSDYSVQWEILRGYHQETTARKASSALTWESALPLSGYVVGLSRLQASDIFALRNPKGEYGAFLTALADRAGQRTESSDEVARRLIAYERKIVERILGRFPELQSTAGPRLEISASVHDLLGKSHLGLTLEGAALATEMAKVIGVSIFVGYGPYILALTALGVAADMLHLALRNSSERRTSALEAERLLEESRLKAALTSEADRDMGALRLAGTVERDGLGDQIYKHQAI